MSGTDRLGVGHERAIVGGATHAAFAGRTSTGPSRATGMIGTRVKSAYELSKKADEWREVYQQVQDLFDPDKRTGAAVHLASEALEKLATDILGIPIAHPLFAYYKVHIDLLAEALNASAVAKDANLSPVFQALNEVRSKTFSELENYRTTGKRFREMQTEQGGLYIASSILKSELDLAAHCARSSEKLLKDIGFVLLKGHSIGGECTDLFKELLLLRIAAEKARALIVDKLAAAQRSLARLEEQGGLAQKFGVLAQAAAELSAAGNEGVDVEQLPERLDPLIADIDSVTRVWAEALQKWQRDFAALGLIPRIQRLMHTAS